MLTKEQIQRLKRTDLDQLYRALRAATSAREIVFLLENLGRLPETFDGAVLLPFLRHESEQVRYWAVKNLGRTRDRSLIPQLAQLAQTEPDSIVRREAISAIGRMRAPEAVPLLIELLSERDPKALLQVVRALLVFRAQPEVQAALQRLRDHPNELIQSVIQREFAAELRAELPAQHVESPAFMRNVVVHGLSLIHI
jgi:HEAT repeat protein